MTEQQDIERLADTEAEDGRMRPEVLDPEEGVSKAFYFVVLLILGFIAGMLFSTAAFAKHEHESEYPEDCMNHEVMSAMLRSEGFQPFFVGVDGDDDDYVIVVWTHDSEGLWLLHELYREQDMQCHIMGGYDFADRSVLGDPV